MTVICVSVQASKEQVVSGIPKIVSISTNIPATIFFTLDGTTPTLFSTIYTSPIFLPYDQLVVSLSILASNGVDSSPIIVETYQTNITGQNARLPHSSTTVQPGGISPDTYPFGTPPFQPNQQFLNPAKSGVTVYNPALPSQPTTFDGTGNPTGFTNQPFNTLNYQIAYTDRDAEGDQGGNIGNIPGKVTVAVPPPNPEQSQQFTTAFNPRAFVIFQDFSKEDPNDPPTINRNYFTLEDPEKVRDGSYFSNVGPDSTAPPSGSFVKSHYNPRTNQITYYYRDNWQNRWIISTSPYHPNGPWDGNMAASVIGRSSKVFEWLPFARRYLF